LADNVSILTKAASFGTNLAGPVNLVDSRFVVDPKENFAGGGLKVEKGAELKEKFQNSRGTK
jgi:hypothetical protein